MDTVLERPWTTEAFLAWEDRQEAKHEFDGRPPLRVACNTIAHQDIVFRLTVALRRLSAGKPVQAIHRMRLRIGSRVRYPDVLVAAEPIDQATRTLTDALVIFEVLSDDTATTDRIDKLVDYAAVPSLRGYVLLEQARIGATLFRRAPDRTWIASAHPEGVLDLPGLDVALPLAPLYQGLTLPG